jgi:cell wall-associated NlpC family hydrolase
MSNVATIPAVGLLAFAQSQVGVPWVHVGRAPGQGLDCAGLIEGGIVSLGRKPVDCLTYSEHPQAGLLGRTLLANGFRRMDGENEPGDVLTFWIRRKDEEVHGGIYEGHGRMIHTRRELGGGKVRREALGRFWSERLMARWRLS